jgi:hypothetical protein
VPESASAQPDKTVNTSGGPVNTSVRPDAACYTMPDGSCVSEGPCLHTPPDTCSRCDKTLSEDELVYLIFDANSEVKGRLCEPCEEAS